MPYAFLCLIPFLVLAKGTIMAGHQMGLGVFAPLLAWGLVKSLPARLFILWAVLWAAAIRVIYLMDVIDVKSAKDASDFSLMIALFLLMYAAATRYGSIEGWSNAICVIAVCQMLLAVCQINGFDPFLKFLGLFHPDIRMALADTTPTGSLGNNNFLAGFLAISSPFFMRKHWVWFLVPICGVIFISHTSGALFAILAGLIWVYWRKWWAIAGIVLIVAAYVFWIDPNGRIQFTMVKVGRFDLWMQAAAPILSNPILFLLGCGPGSPLPYGSHLHNDFLEVWYYYGMIGFGFVAWYTIQTYLKATGTLKAAFLIIILFASTSLPTFLVPSAMLMAVIFGLCERETNAKLLNIC